MQIQENIVKEGLVKDIQARYNLGERNFSGLDLSHGNLSGINLAGANLQNVDFANSDLRGSILDDADLRQANLRHVNLRGASLKKADLEQARLIDIDVTESVLTGCNLKDSTVERLKGHKTLLQGAILPDGSIWVHAFPLPKGVFHRASLLQAAQKVERKLKTLSAAIFLLILFFGVDFIQLLLNRYITLIGH